MKKGLIEWGRLWIRSGFHGRRGCTESAYLPLLLFGVALLPSPAPASTHLRGLHRSVASLLCSGFLESSKEAHPAELSALKPSPPARDSDGLNPPVTAFEAVLFPITHLATTWPRKMEPIGTEARSGLNLTRGWHDAKLLPERKPQAQVRLGQETPCGDVVARDVSYEVRSLECRVHGARG